MVEVVKILTGTRILHTRLTLIPGSITFRALNFTADGRCTFPKKNKIK